MIKWMTPRIFRRPDRWWALLLVVSVGFWAGGAVAQSGAEPSGSDGGWFDEPEDTERPLLRIHGNASREVPPPDFQADAAPSPARDLDGRDEELLEGGVLEPEALEDEALEEIEDAESQRRAAQEFAPRLAPYGRWIDDPFYGRVWLPSRRVVGGEFRPYVTGGRWELTSGDDWLWVSDYPFGWITFHYGRWAWLSAGSWGWIPGSVYAPAWVDFRIGADGYLGWGPAPPFSAWRGGVFVSLGVYRPVPYVFCPTPYVFSRSLPRYIVHDRHRVRSIAAHTHRYRPRHVAGAHHRVRGPSPREARIPRRYVPTKRVIAQPRRGPGGADVRGPREYRDYQKYRAVSRPRVLQERDRARPRMRPQYREAAQNRGTQYRGTQYRERSRDGGGFSRYRATTRMPEGRWRSPARPRVGGDVSARERQNGPPRARPQGTSGAARWRGEAAPRFETRSNQPRRPPAARASESRRAPAARAKPSGRAPAARATESRRQVRERRSGSSRPARSPAQQRSRRPER